MEENTYNYYFVTNNGRPVRIHKTLVDINTSINRIYVPFSQQQVEYYETYPEATTYEVWNLSPRPSEHVPTLDEAKFDKIVEIEQYDISDNVNRFYYNGQPMWLDRDTRASLRNTIESSELLGRETLNIWFGDLRITLPLSSAKLMLATLEMYATDCYNVTALHKAQVSTLTRIDDVLSFDVTDGYPEMPEFSSQQSQE